MIVSLLIIAAVTVPKALKPLRADKLPRREAGEWIRSRQADHAVIVTNRPRVGFYAGAKPTTVNRLPNKSSAESVYLTLDMDRKPANQMKRILKTASFSHIYIAVVGSEKFTQPPDWLAEAAASKWKVGDGPVFQSKGETVSLYKIVKKSTH
jgi:hypothetical protein